MRRVLEVIAAASLTAAAWTCAPAVAQGYPNRPITLVVPYSPGAAVDFLARTLAQKMSENMGQPIVVENRTGAVAP